MLQVLGGSGIVALSGCGSVPGASSVSVNNMEPTVEGGQAVVSFEYSVGDYATALFEGPDGRVISETRIEPDHSTASVPIGTLESGEYELLIRQDGDTVTSQELSVDGADPFIRDITSTWTYNELDSVIVELENVGDTPAYIGQVEFELEPLDRDYNPSDTVNGYLDAGEALAANIEPVGGVQIDDSGTTEGTVIAETDSEPLTEAFSHELAPASLTFMSVEPNWDGTSLVDVTARIRNTGDVPTSAQITAIADGNELDTTPTNQIEPGGAQDFLVQDFGTLYEATSGGEAEVNLAVESPAGSISETVTREIAGADVSIDSVSAEWESGQLEEVTAEIGNSGDIDVEAPLTLSVDGTEIVATPITVPGGTDPTETIIYDATGSYEGGYAITSGGSYEVAVEIEVEDGVVSGSDSKEFDGRDVEFSNIQTTFFSAGYETDDVELASVDFSVRNDGDVVLEYDSVKVEFSGASRSEGLYSTRQISPDSSADEYISLSDEITTSPGEVDLTISLLLGGEEVESTSTTVTAE